MSNQATGPRPPRLSVIMDGGVVLEQGPPEQVFDSPAQARTRQFLQRVLDT